MCAAWGADRKDAALHNLLSYMKYVQKTLVMHITRYPFLQTLLALVYMKYVQKSHVIHITRDSSKYYLL
jgi:hypothetical protein